jgi:hypothetical protein
MVLIKQATFGDETSATDITQSLQGKVTNGYLAVVADSKLLPSVTLNTNAAELTQEDKDLALKQAIEQCNGANDQACLAERSGKFEQSLLQQRVAEQNATDKTVKGRRLTVTVIDDYGKEQTLQIPDGQEFKLGNPPAGAATASTGVSLASIAAQLASVIFGAILLFLWVFSVVATYRTLLDAGYRVPVYIGTATAILIPYSGYLIMLFYFFFVTYLTS